MYAVAWLEYITATWSLLPFLCTQHMFTCHVIHALTPIGSSCRPAWDNPRVTQQSHSSPPPPPPPLPPGLLLEVYTPALPGWMVKLITDQRANFVLQWLQQHHVFVLSSQPLSLHTSTSHPSDSYPTNTSRMGITQHKYNRSVLKTARTTAAATKYVTLTLWKTYGEFIKVTQSPFFYLTESNFQMHSLFILGAPHLDTLYATEALITSQFFIYFSFHLHCQWSDRAWGRVWLTCFSMEIYESSETQSTMTLRQLDLK